MWSTLAILIIICAVGRGRDPFADQVNVEHIHNLGKLLFAFTCFWGYIAFLPDDAHLDRQPARGDAVLTSCACRASGRRWDRPDHRPLRVPFALLLSRDLKRNPAG
jgi:hypothetical protein